MKNLFVIIIIIGSFIQLSAQEIGFYTTYSSSSFSKFQKNSGLGITYSQVLKSNHRIGVKVQYSFCNSDYDEVYESNEDGVSTYIKKTDPDNQRLLLSVNYAFGIINNPLPLVSRHMKRAVHNEIF